MRDRPQRSWLERALMVAPEVYRPLMDPLFRLPPSSRLRRAALRTIVDRSYAALNRSDLELVKRLFYHPDMALNFAADVGMDFDSRYEGREACFDAYSRWMHEWDGVRREPVGFVDRGDVLVVLCRELMRGASSGLAIDRELAQVFRLRGAGVIEQTEFDSWDKALAHAG